jgi:hypothetical protein
MSARIVATLVALALSSAIIATCISIANAITRSAAL